MVNVNIHAEEELRFTESIYNFSAVTYSNVGAICGKVTVMHETYAPPIALVDYQCGYSLLAGDMVPFTVDSHGKTNFNDSRDTGFVSKYHLPGGKRYDHKHLVLLCHNNNLWVCNICH
ncbi:unnamed protein product [Hydatigera taeniaeformis]|uniref:Uncharacterized protein n=1 Tax=Hydatigena taeniaeformis TaxID=6205 RepID=A0A3P7F0T3_HYDTA|nr:unnamed protein product [Hydatigera taeniaeformis]